MKVTIERTTDSEAVLNVEFEWGELEKASDRAYRKLAQQYNVPGFRKGHAPRSMIERMLGKEAVYQEGLEELIESSYREAIRENDLTPLGQPALEAPPIELGQPYAYVARVPVLAPVTLGDYAAVRVEHPSAEVSDEEIDAVLERLRQDQAMWLPVERPAAVGDKVSVDLKLTVGEKQVSDLHDNEFELAEERPGIFSGMDAQVIGMSEGETKEFTTTIPEDYANTELAGKEAQYVVTVKGVKFRELPELDDELAKSVGEYETVAALRVAVAQQLGNQKETEAHRTMREQIVKEVTDGASVDIHPVLVHEEVDTMLDEMKRMLSQSRMTLEQFLSMTQKTEEQYREELEPEARERAKRDRVLDAVAEAEGLSVSDQDIAGWLELFAAMGGKRTRMSELTRGQKANIAVRLRRDKAMTRLEEIATQDHQHGERLAADGDDATVDTAPASADAAEAALATATVSAAPEATPSAAKGSSAPMPSVTASPTAAPEAQTAASGSMTASDVVDSTQVAGTADITDAATEV